MRAEVMHLARRTRGSVNSLETGSGSPRGNMDDPKVELQIQDILFPQEFTRLDRIIDLVFATAEEAQDFEACDADEESDSDESAPEIPRANFHSAILPRLEKHFGQPLVKRSRSQWATPDDTVLVSCQVSKHFDKGADFWFGLKRNSRESLKEHKNAFCAFGLGSPERVVILPMSFLDPNVDALFSSPDKAGGIQHWHVRFVNTDIGVAMLIDRDRRQLDVSMYLLKDQ